mmetsp:Transcript_72768/g.135972  ORF Transcript_72768/g.135972 Transcript_72768/m.135972 type:complete len:212 (-) Transcript_72768:28-663(-)
MPVDESVAHRFQELCPPVCNVKASTLCVRDHHIYIPLLVHIDLSHRILHVPSPGFRWSTAILILTTTLWPGVYQVLKLLSVDLLQQMGTQPTLHRCIELGGRLKVLSNELEKKLRFATLHLLLTEVAISFGHLKFRPIPSTSSSFLGSFRLIRRLSQKPVKPKLHLGSWLLTSSTQGDQLLSREEVTIPLQEHMRRLSCQLCHLNLLLIMT